LIRNLWFLHNTISTFQMTEIMILSSLNIVSNCIGIIWLKMITPLNLIGFGLMVVLHNSKILSLGFLWISIPTWQMAAKWFGISSTMVMERAHMMVLVLLQKVYSKSTTWCQRCQIAKCKGGYPVIAWTFVTQTKDII